VRRDKHACWIWKWGAEGFPVHKHSGGIGKTGGKNPRQFLLCREQHELRRVTCSDAHNGTLRYGDRKQDSLSRAHRCLGTPVRLDRPDRCAVVTTGTPGTEPPTSVLLKGTSPPSCSSSRIPLPLLPLPKPTTCKSSSPCPEPSALRASGTTQATAWPSRLPPLRPGCAGSTLSCCHRACHGPCYFLAALGHVPRHALRGWRCPPLHVVPRPQEVRRHFVSSHFLHERARRSAAWLVNRRAFHPRGYAARLIPCQRPLPAYVTELA